MRPVRISGADPRPIGAPADWSEDQNGHCGALFVRREEIAGVAYMRSAWEPEGVEAILMAAGANLQIGVSGWVHPVLQVGTGPLPDDFEPTVVARKFTTLQGVQAVRVDMLYPHAGGRRGYCEIEIESTLAAAVAEGVKRIEKMAKNEGWVA